MMSATDLYASRPAACACEGCELPLLSGGRKPQEVCNVSAMTSIASQHSRNPRAPTGDGRANGHGKEAMTDGDDVIDAAIHPLQCILSRSAVHKRIDTDGEDEVNHNALDHPTTVDGIAGRDTRRHEARGNKGLPTLASSRRRSACSPHHTRIPYTNTNAICRPNQTHIQTASRNRVLIPNRP